MASSSKNSHTQVTASRACVFPQAMRGKKPFTLRSWEMPKITSHDRLPFEHENNLPHLTWLYWLIPVALLVKDDESLPWPKTQEKEKISVTFDN